METDSGTVSPRPFGEIPGLWLKVFKMDESFFAAEAPRVSSSNTQVGLLIYTVVTVIIQFIQQRFGFRPAYLQKYYLNNPQMNIPICLPLVLLVVVPLGYYIGIGLMHLGARIFGGKGSSTTLAYLTSLFYLPLGMVIVLLNLIPILGGIIGIGLGIYDIMLTVRVIKVNYQLTTGRAVGAYFVPTLVILLILVPVCVIGTLAVMGPSIGNIFSNVIQSLATPVP